MNLDASPKADWGRRFWAFALHYFAVPSFAWDALAFRAGAGTASRITRELEVLFNAVQLVLLVVFVGGTVLTLDDGWIFQVMFSILISMHGAIMAVRAQYIYQQQGKGGGR